MTLNDVEWAGPGGRGQLYLAIGSGLGTVISVSILQFIILLDYDNHGMSLDNSSPGQDKAFTTGDACPGVS